jgi:hypothetical protein
MDRFDIGPGIYRRTPGHLAGPLRMLGLGDNNFPRPHLDHYDPMNLLSAMAVHEGLGIRSLGCSEQQLVHVGGVSYGERRTWLDYFHQRLLEFPRSRPFAASYRQRLGLDRSPRMLRRDLSELGQDAVAHRIDLVIERLESALSPT